MFRTRICRRGSDLEVYPDAERRNAERSPVPTPETGPRSAIGPRRPLPFPALRVGGDSGTNRSQSGFTLAGLLVILTIIAVFVAYTVPRQWSIVMARERDQQTVFAMKQYARAIKAFQEKNKAMPVSLDQLKQARQPRLMRGKGELIDPLTGKVDWIVVPASAIQGQPGAGGQQLPPGVAPSTPAGAGTTTDPRGGMVIGYSGAPAGVPNAPIPGGAPAGAQPAPGSPGGTVGPIVGVRPNKTGTSYLVVKGMDTYDQWVYTTVDLENDIATARNALMVK